MSATRAGCWLVRPDGVRLRVHGLDGDPGLAPVVLGHGAGSRPTFVHACFAGALADCGLRAVTYDARGHGQSTPVTAPGLLGLDAHAGDLGAVVALAGARLAGGISLGAHAAAWWAAGAGAGHLDGLLLAAPGWLGPPGVVAAANAAQADELERVGLPAVLDRLAGEPLGWLGTELAAWWPAHRPAAFAAVLRALAAAPAPGAAELARLVVPVGVAGLADDPMHPSGAAQAWADALPRGRYAETSLSAMATDRGALGAAAVRAWLAAGS